jgi:ornithine cyclodeaminase
MRHFDARAVTTASPFPALVAALRQAFADGCEVPPRQVLAISDASGQPCGTTLLMPAWRRGGCYGVKIVNVFPGNGAQGLSALHATYTLFDAATGVPLAGFDGSELTSRRTVAASALAASMLAREDARCLLVVGAGRLANLLPEAMRAVRPGLDRILVWNHRGDRAAQLAAALRQRGLTAQAAGDLRAAVGQADIVSCATLSEVALVQGAWLRPGTHLDLIGAFTPSMRECDSTAVASARVFVDGDEALAKGGDLVQAISEGAFSAGDVCGTLRQLCRGEVAGRGDDHQVTLFKSVGTALEDLAAAELIWSHR